MQVEKCANLTHKYIYVYVLQGNMDVIVGSSGREGPLVLHGDGQEPSGEALMRNHVRVRLRGGGALGSRVTVHQWDPLLGDHAMGNVLASVVCGGVSGVVRAVC